MGSIGKRMPKLYQEIQKGKIFLHHSYARIINDLKIPVYHALEVPKFIAFVSKV